MAQSDVLLVACSGDMGAGKTTFVTHLQRRLAQLGYADNDIAMPKFADPLYRVMGWFTCSRDRLFLQQLADLLRDFYGESVLADLLVSRIRGMVEGGVTLPYHTPDTPCGVDEAARRALCWFVSTPERAHVVSLCSLIRRFYPGAVDIWVGAAPVQPVKPRAILSDDMRTDVEYCALAGLGFHLVRIDCPTEVRQARCQAAGVWNPTHSTEGKLSNHQFDSIVYNGTDDELALVQQVDALLSSLG